MNLSKNRSNNIIDTAHKLCGILMGLIILIFIVLVAIVFYSISNPDMFSTIKVDGMLNAGSNLNFQICNNCNTSNTIALSDLDSLTKIILLVRSSLLLIIVFFILKTVRKILINMTTYSIFVNSNVQYFKMLFKLTTFLCLISSINVHFLNDQTNWRFTIPIKTMILAFGFLVLSEIFKEGKKLEEDKNSII